MTAELTARAVLAKASAYDPLFRKPDPIIITAWAEALENVTDVDAALAAVTDHYSQISERSLMPADVINRVKAARVSRPELRPMRDVIADLDRQVDDDRARLQVDR
jgi:hypothetical protein